MFQKHKALFQVAAIPFRYELDSLKVLLLTTRRKRNWIIPKGWPIEGLNFRQSAEQEAMEEAGVKGSISKDPIGDFIHLKKIARGQRVPCTVVTYGLHVTEQLTEWIEKGQRDILWCSPLRAAKEVKNPGLSALLQNIGSQKSVLSQKRHLKLFR
jgi:8-oxo-dGTP pyrophosphatase MutT (NUDIX family)